MTHMTRNGEDAMTNASTPQRHDWGPWVLTPPDGQPYLKPLPDPTRRYRPRLIAPQHPTLAKLEFIASEARYFDLNDFVDAPKVLRRLARIAC